MTDKHYTPPKVAHQLLHGIQLCKSPIIADFTCGEGALLFAAYSHWPAATYIANDQDSSVLSQIGTRLPTVQTSAVDCLNQPAFDQQFDSYLGAIDLIMWNPPFSARGGTVYFFNEQKLNFSLRCSKALYFVMQSLKLLSDGGIVIALLPSGIRSSERDREALNWLMDNFSCEWRESFDRTTFSQCNPNTSILRIKNTRPERKYPINSPAQPSCPLRETRYLLYRGCLPIYKCTIHKSTYCVIHTTTLHPHGKRKAPRFTNRSSHSLTGHFLLIPRVGRPLIHYIAITHVKAPSVLSDCVIAISAAQCDLEYLCNHIKTNFSEFCHLYTGTCAKYVTIKKLEKFLNTIE